jgi:hypothetical protein
VAVPQATAYDKSAAKHKVLYFETYHDHLLEFPKELPQDWQVSTDASSDVYAKVDLVVCSVRTSDTVVKTCTDYKDDQGKASTHDITLHNANYKIAVHEATSGKELTTKDVAATADCPQSYTFSSDDPPAVDYYAAPQADQVVALAKPFAQP